MGIKGITRRAPVGKRFGRVVVIGRPDAISRSSPVVLCRCDCGDERDYFVANLTVQTEPMCPPCRTDSRASKGRSGRHPLFNIWKAIIQRCENPKHDAYPLYGGRGVTICDRWRNDFDAFATDVGPRPSRQHTIDRIDNDGNYEPGNTRWATWSQQGRNRRNTVMVEWRGRSISLNDAAELAGLDHATLAWRLKRGWATERAMTTPSLMATNKGRPKPRKAA